MHPLLRLLQAFVFILIVACHKQEAPTVQSDKPKTEMDRVRLESCGSSSFTKNLLEHDNVVNLFECLKWDQKFGSLHQEIRSYDKQSWNYLLMPISGAWFEGARRDRLLGELKNLDQQAALNDFSRLIQEVNSTQLIEATNILFKCADNPELEICHGRTKVLSRDEIKQLLKLAILPEESFIHASMLIRDLAKTFKKVESDFKLNYSVLASDAEYLERKIKLIDSLAKKIIVESTKKEERTLWSNLFLTKSESDSTKPWIYNWVNSPVFDLKTFTYAYTYPFMQDSLIVDKFKAYGTMINKGVHCSGRLDSGVNYSARGFTEDYFKKIIQGGYAGYIDGSMTFLNIIAVAHNFCPELRDYKIGEPDNDRHSFDLSKLISQVFDFFEQQHYFDFFNFIIKSSSTTFSEQKDKRYTYIIEMLSDDVFKQANSLNEKGHIIAPEFTNVLYKFIKNLEPSTYTNIGSYLSLVLNEDNVTSIKALSKYWLFLSKEEKSDFLKVLDLVLDQDFKSVPLLAFLGKLTNEHAQIVKNYKNTWFSNEDKLYADVASGMQILSKDEVKKDINDFTSRDHLTKVIEILSRGLDITSAGFDVADQIEINSNILVVSDPKGDEAYFKKFHACFRKIYALDYNLHEMLSKWPKECDEIKDDQITFEILSLMNHINIDYKEAYNLKSGIFDRNGLISPEMLRTVFVFSEIIDSDNVKGKGGVAKLIQTSYELLYLYKRSNNRQGFYSLLDELNSTLSKMIKVDEKNQTAWRNQMLQTLLTQKKPEEIRTELKTVSKLLLDFSIWLSDSNNLLPKSRRIIQNSAKFDCEVYLNQNMGTVECPSTDRIKNISRVVFHFLKRKTDYESPTLMANLLKSFVPNEGIEIPYRSQHSQKYWLTLKETFKFLYDLTDKNLPSNNKVVAYINSNEGHGYYIPKELSNLPRLDDAINDDFGPQKLTTMERIEASARDSRVQTNYMAAHYNNAIALSDNYVKTVESKKDLLDRCIKYKMCGKDLTEVDNKLLKNTRQLLDGLVDLDKPPFKYGNYMKTLMTTVVASSAQSVQQDTLIKFNFFGVEIELPKIFGDKELANHNGHVFTRLSQLSFFSNLGRFLHKKFNGDRNEFEKFIASKDFNVVNKYLFSSLDVKKSEKILNSIIEKSLEEDEEGNFFDRLVEWSQTLSDEQRVLVEEVFGRLMTVTSFIGVPDNLYENNSSEVSKKLFQKYKDNSVDTFLNIMDAMIPYSLNIQRALEANNIDLFDLIKKLNVFLKFYQEGVLKSEVAHENIYYQALNDSLILFNNLLLKEIGPNGANGMTFFKQVLTNQDMLNHIFKFVKDFDDIAEFLKQKDEEGKSNFNKISTSMVKLASDDRIVLEDIFKYVGSTTRLELCANQVCSANEHYDEPAKLIQYMSLISKNSAKNETNLVVVLNNLLVKNRKKISDTLDEIFGNTFLVKRTNELN